MGTKLAASYMDIKDIDRLAKTGLFTDEQIAVMRNQMFGHNVADEEDEMAIPTNKPKLVVNNTIKHPEVTTLHDLQSYTVDTVVQLPDFAEGQPLVARVKRPSMLKLAASGKIPNRLLTTAGKLFTGTSADIAAQDNKQLLHDMYDVCMVMASATLVEPTVEQIEEAGLSLTDEQLMAIFNYTQTGVKALENFRK